MSLYGALRSGVSGLFVQTQAMAMISDNIANVNTNGYKLTEPRFSTLVTTATSPNFYSSGGVQSSIAREIDGQGLLQASSTSTDLAIQGQGFFTVTDELTLNTTTNEYEITGSVFYTRAGEFRADKDGNLVNAAGFFLTGWPRNTANTGFSITNVQTAFNGVNVASQSASPIPTQNINISANLNSSAATGDTFETTLQVFDRQGTQKSLTLTFTRNSTANTWDITTTLTGGGQFIDPDTNNDGTMGLDADTNNIISNTEVTTANADNALAGATAVSLGQIVFNSDGSLNSLVGQNGNTSIGVNGNAGLGQLQLLIDHDASLATSNDAVAVNIDFGTLNGNDGLTQFNGNSNLNGFSQDGKQFGSLTGVSVNEAGVVTALFDNGDTRQLYQVPVTTFNNANGLQARSGNVFSETEASGSAIAHISGTGGAGTVAPSAIEASTVDIADEFTDMITTQRAYSASTKIITTADEMLEELIRTKR